MLVLNNRALMKNRQMNTYHNSSHEEFLIMSAEKPKKDLSVFPVPSLSKNISADQDQIAPYDLPDVSLQY